LNVNGIMPMGNPISEINSFARQAEARKAKKNCNWGY
jgi:hypothetical protein